MKRKYKVVLSLLVILIILDILLISIVTVESFRNKNNKDNPKSNLKNEPKKNNKGIYNRLVNFSVLLNKVKDSAHFTLEKCTLDEKNEEVCDTMFVTKDSAQVVFNNLLNADMVESNATDVEFKNYVLKALDTNNNVVTYIECVLDIREIFLHFNEGEYSLYFNEDFNLLQMFEDLVKEDI